MKDELIGFLHVIGSLILSLYFLWRSPFFDGIYVIYFLLVNLSWIMLKDECFVSYLFKKSQDSQYELGDSPQDIQDYKSILGRKGADTFVYFIRSMMVLNISYIIYLGPFNTTYTVLIFLSAFSYVFYISTFDNKHTYSKEEVDSIKFYHRIIIYLTLFYATLLYSGFLRMVRAF